MTDMNAWSDVGAEAVGLTGQKAADLRDLSTSLVLGDLQPTGDRR